MARTAKPVERPTHRTVILLRRSDKLKLASLASRGKVSSAEVIRRFIESHDSIPADEESLMESALKIMSDAISEANASLVRTNRKLDKLHRELKKRDIR